MNNKKEKSAREEGRYSEIGSPLGPAAAATQNEPERYIVGRNNQDLDRSITGQFQYFFEFK